jgi:hypothetical protein
MTSAAPAIAIAVRVNDEAQRDAMITRDADKLAGVLDDDIENRAMR